MPTRDIHMNQVGFDENWLEIIRSYVVPVNGKVFPGYHSKVSSKSLACSSLWWDELTGAVDIAW